MNDQDNDFEDNPLQDSTIPRLVGTTAGEYEESIEASKSLSSTRGFSNYFKDLQWSPDGTTVLTSSADNALRSYVLPPTLLNPPHPHLLKPYATHQSPEPEYARTFYPSYSLSDPSTCLFLASPRNLPIRLYSTLGSGVLGSYPLVSPTTEAFISPHSLLFDASDRNQFFAGSSQIIAVFDISRPGEGPVTVMKTGHSRYPNPNGFGSAIKLGDGLTNIVSALDISRGGVLAAGTFGRKVGLYDNNGHGEATAVFSLRDDSDIETHGNGVTEVIWDESGRYLCVAERGSDGVSVWDIRGTGKRLAWLRGRRAKTSQRMGVALMHGEVWAGGTDGIVRVWREIGNKEGSVERDWEFDAHGDVVSGTGLHPGGSVLSTCSGQRVNPAVVDWEVDGNDSDSESPIAEAKAIDNSLRIWAL